MSTSNFQTEYQNVIRPELQKTLGKSNALAVPRLTKVVVNMGIGKIRDGKEQEEVRAMLARITGQLPEPRETKKAIASFKTREGMVVGYRVTLRGQRAYDFLAKTIRAALARTRDFRGIPLSSADEHGNLHIGIREHIVFPEMIGEDFHHIYSFQVTAVSTATSKDDAMALWKAFGVPFEKAEGGK